MLKGIRAGAAILALAGGLVPGIVLASAFIGGSSTLSLNIRSIPKPLGTLRGAYAVNEMISFTGKCRQYNSSYSAVTYSFDMQLHTQAFNQAKVALPRVWCQVWHDKQGPFESGWVRTLSTTIQ